METAAKARAFFVNAAHEVNSIFIENYNINIYVIVN